MGKTDLTQTDATLQQAAQTDIYQLFRSRAAGMPNAIALIERGKQLSYTQLLQRVDQLAGHFVRLGLNAGDRIAILSRNRQEYIEVELAAAATGLITACLNWRLLPAELHHCITLVSPRLIVSEPDLCPLLEQVPDIPQLCFGTPYEDALAQAPDFTAKPQDPEGGLVILYTSGTTGLPKGAVISHRAMIARSAVFASELGLAPDDGFVAWAPMFHMASTDHALSTLLRGGAVVMIDGYDAELICHAIETQRIGWMVLIPGMIEPLTAHIKERGITPKGIHICGAMADLVPPHQIGEITKLLDAPYLNSFGSTETGLPPATRSLIPIGVTPESLSKQTSAFCALRLVDEEGNDVPTGTPGELAMRGPTLFSGYWNAEAANAEAFRGGWFHMGDVFRRNADGTFDFADRAKYLIKTGGENVYPAEIERVLMADPHVTDAAVVRVSDDRWGEVPVAFVSRDDDAVTEDSLLAACGAALARYKQPRDIHIIAFEDFPRSTSGKIQRHVLEAGLRAEKS
ncbi:MAG: AMP-binding protein [Rhodobacteraceae bacterium]|nr:AMP-binding protein [Paracoccaceae bacterium]